jgi:hypothetical protein
MDLLFLRKSGPGHQSGSGKGNGKAEVTFLHDFSCSTFFLRRRQTTPEILVFSSESRKERFSPQEGKRGAAIAAAIEKAGPADDRWSGLLFALVEEAGVDRLAAIRRRG